MVIYDDGSKALALPSPGGLWFVGPAAVTKKFVWPFSLSKANIYNGYPDDGFMTPGRPTHNGMDFGYGGVTYGVPIGAAASGTVVEAYEDDDDYGVQVTIDHGTFDGVNVKTFYAHMQSGSITRNVGDSIGIGETVGLTGSTGNSTGAHLHFVVYINDVAVDPLGFMATANPTNEFVR